MATTLCEKCFPDWGHHEVQSKAIIAICEECQKTEAQDDVKLHTFRGDPRSKASDTPRVDAASFKVIGPVPERATSVPAEMARELERELAAVTRGRDEARAELAVSEKCVSGYMAERNQARDLVRAKNAEIDALRAEVERLRGAIKGQASLLPLLPTAPPGSYARGYDSGMRDTITAISAALQEPTL